TGSWRRLRGEFHCVPYRLPNGPVRPDPMATAGKAEPSCLPHGSPTNRGWRYAFMKKGITGVFGLAVLVFGASLVGSPALAKCGQDCKKQIADVIMVSNRVIARRLPGHTRRRDGH